MNPSNTCRVGRSCNIVQAGKEARPAIHDDISDTEDENEIDFNDNVVLLEMEELCQEITHPTQSPEIQRFHYIRLNDDIIDSIKEDVGIDGITHMTSQGMLIQEAKTCLSDSEPGCIS